MSSVAQFVSHLRRFILEFLFETGVSSFHLLEFVISFVREARFLGYCFFRFLVRIFVLLLCLLFIVHCLRFPETRNKKSARHLLLPFIFMRLALFHRHEDCRSFTSSFACPQPSRSSLLAFLCPRVLFFYRVLRLRRVWAVVFANTKEDVC